MGVYLFMLAGYRGVFNFFDKAISRDLIVQLDKHEYTDAELVEVKIHYPMLYAPNWTSYERYDGEVELNGAHYNYVKRKFSNDTLYFLCIPNHQKTQLEAARVDYIRRSNDVVNPMNGKKSLPVSTGCIGFSWEYHNLVTAYGIQSPDALFTRTYSPAQYALCHIFSTVTLQPPRPPHTGIV